MSMLHEAILFSANAHAGQKRKGTDIPYITHPFEVAQILTEAGCGEPLIVAGLLHDTLEDTHVTAGEIESRFGPEVLALVQSDSEDKSLSWEERKEHTIRYLRKSASREELLLACADKLSNLRSIKADYQTDGDRIWARFNRGKEQQSWYYSSLVDTFEPLSGYKMYWEISNLYTDIFVTYYFDADHMKLYQSSGMETYWYGEDHCTWERVRPSTWKKLSASLRVIPKADAIALEDEWREGFPSLPCLLRNRTNTAVIVACAERLLREGCGPAWFSATWNNLGGGLPPDTLRALECAFMALYQQRERTKSCEYPPGNQ